MTDSTFQDLKPEQEAFNDPTQVAQAEIFKRQSMAPSFGPKSETIAPHIEALHEISGMTEGKMKIGDSEVYVTVVVADKSNQDTKGKRNGVGVLAISYEDPQAENLVYKEIDIVRTDGNGLAGPISKDNPDDPKEWSGPGFEDMSWRDGDDGGTYYFVNEGGGKAGNLTAPQVYTAKLVQNNGTYQMRLVSDTPINVDVPPEEYSTLYNGQANGAEGMAVDSHGNIYVGMQNTGKIYKGTLQSDGTYNWRNKDGGCDMVLNTGHSDLAGLAFDGDDTLLVGFGSYSNGIKNSVETWKFSSSSEAWSKDQNAGAISINAVHGNKIHDAEAIMVDHNHDVYAGSDNGELYGKLNSLTESPQAVGLVQKHAADNTTMP